MKSKTSHTDEDWIHSLAESPLIDESNFISRPFDFYHKAETFHSWLKGIFHDVLDENQMVIDQYYHGDYNPGDQAKTT